MRLLVIPVLAFTLSVPNAASAGLSRQDRDELFQRVDQMCRNASSVGQVLTYEGSLEAGATLKIVGIDAKGKVSKEQWKNIEQKYGEFRTNPVVCNFEMIKIIQPLFGNYECRTKANGVERYQREFNANKSSHWMSGGFTQPRWCDQVITEFRSQHPEGEVSFVSSSERSESRCKPFNCPQYMYNCVVHIKTDPLYKEPIGGC